MTGRLDRRAAAAGRDAVIDRRPGLTLASNAAEHESADRAAHPRPTMDRLVQERGTT
jgi:hypothetical protein